MQNGKIENLRWNLFVWRVSLGANLTRQSKYSHLVTKLIEIPTMTRSLKILTIHVAKCRSTILLSISTFLCHRARATFDPVT